MAQLVKNLPVMQETWVGKIPWRKERLPIPVFWPREFRGLYSPWGCKESDMTEQLSHVSVTATKFIIHDLFSITISKEYIFYLFLSSHEYNRSDTRGLECRGLLVYC